jgi:signal peptidase
VFAALAFTVIGPALGWRVNVVFSGSMEPAIHTGSVIITGPIAPEQVMVGDIVIYSSGRSYTTHRVIDIVHDPGLQFITKGDANEDPDPSPIPAEWIAGRFFYHIPYLGYVIAFLKTPLGLVLTIGIPALILFAYEVDRRWIRENG